MIKKYLSILAEWRVRFVLIAALCVPAIILGALHFSHAYQEVGERSGMPGYNHIPDRRFAAISQSEMARRSDEDVLSYVARMNQLVHFSTFHCNPTAYSLSTIEVLVSRAMHLRGYRFDWNEGLYDERMLCGFCHQRAIILARVLENNGVQAMAFGLNGHVVTHFRVDSGAQYLVDPDYGAPPYRYDASNAVVREEIGASYDQTLFAGSATDDVFLMVTSRDDNKPYSSSQHISTIQRNRELLFRISSYLAFTFVFGGGIGLAVLVILQLQRLTSSKRIDG